MSDVLTFGVFRLGDRVGEVYAYTIDEAAQAAALITFELTQVRVANREKGEFIAHGPSRGERGSEPPRGTPLEIRFTLREEPTK